MGVKWYLTAILLMRLSIFSYVYLSFVLPCLLYTYPFFIRLCVLFWYEEYGSVLYLLYIVILYWLYVADIYSSFWILFSFPLCCLFTNRMILHSSRLNILNFTRVEFVSLLLWLVCSMVNSSLNWSHKCILLYITLKFYILPFTFVS